MKKFARWVVWAGALAPIPGFADTTVTVAVEADRPKVVSTLGRVHEASCSAGRKPSVSTPPAHGKLAIRANEKTFDNSASRCHGRKHTGNAYICFPAPGYCGRDSFVLRADTNKGHFQVPEYFTYEILVK